MAVEKFQKLRIIDNKKMIADIVFQPGCHP
jgi:hypothetical protein